MLARPHRLNASRDIQHILKRGQVARAGHLKVYTLPNRLSIIRATTIISKKVDKRAVVRNRNRRRVNEIIRELIPTLKPGFDILVYIQSDLEVLIPTALETEIQQCFKRAGMSKEGSGE